MSEKNGYLMDKRIYYLIIWFLHIILIILKLDWIALGEKWVLILLLEIPLAVLAFAFIGDMRLERESKKYLKTTAKGKITVRSPRSKIKTDNFPDWNDINLN